MSDFTTMGEEYRAKSEALQKIRASFMEEWNNVLQDAVRVAMEEAVADVASPDVYIEDYGESLMLKVGPEENANYIKYSANFSTRRAIIQCRRRGEVMPRRERPFPLNSVTVESVRKDLKNFLHWALGLSH
ncbi:MAG TPA: hypothetical protein VIE43_26730 [Thermoanaerobaculia bacterium]|jgi:hypothetical protein|nr:hypothetical protein [Thermoanaerobaculia bacterium]